MKIRNGFVSNSSSSSFIVFGADLDKNRDTFGFLNMKPEKSYGWSDVRSIRLELPFPEAEYEFGWAFERYYDVKDKINFAIIQALDAGDKKWEYQNMLREVLQKQLNRECGEQSVLTLRIDYNRFYWDSISNEDKAYIDHQSSASEGENLEIFESEEALENFLFNKNSYIQGGNDNEDDTPEYQEAREERRAYFKSIRKNITLEELIKQSADKLDEGYRYATVYKRWQAGDPSLQDFLYVLLHKRKPVWDEKKGQWKEHKYDPVNPINLERWHITDPENLDILVDLKTVKKSH